MYRSPLNSLVTLGAVLFAGMAPAYAAPLDDYLAVRIAERINLSCHALKFVEHSYLPQIAEAFLAETDRSKALRANLMDTSEFEIWQAEIAAEASAKANEAGCSEAATPYLLAARAVASQRIYQDLLLAFHFDSTAAPDRFRAALTDGQKQVAATYEGFLKQIFGEGYLQFSETQRQWAVQRLPRSAFAASEAPASSWGDVGLETLLGTIQTADDIELVTNAQAAGDWAMEHVAL